MDQALKYVKALFLIRFDNVIEIGIKTKSKTHAFVIYIKLLTCKIKKKKNLSGILASIGK